METGTKKKKFPKQAGERPADLVSWESHSVRSTETKVNWKSKRRHCLETQITKGSREYHETTLACTFVDWKMNIKWITYKTAPEWCSETMICKP